MHAPTREEQIRALEQDWAQNPRWKGISRTYSAADVVRLRGSVRIEHTLARARRREALEPRQQRAVRQHARRADRQPGDAAGQGGPEGDLPVGLAGRGRCQRRRRDVSGPVAVSGRTRCRSVVKRINNTLHARRPDPVVRRQDDDIDYFAPIVADAEAGFGGVLNAFELMKAMIEAGAAGVHFEDQLASVKKCGHMGGKVLVPTREAIAKLTAARLAADVMGTPTLLHRAHRRRSRRPRDLRHRRQRQAVPHRRAHGRRASTAPGRASTRRSRAASRMRRTPTWSGAKPASPTSPSRKAFAEAIHKKFPGKLLAYNCSPRFNWKKNLDDATIAKFQRELGAMGYKFQFITLAGFHSLNYSMFNLAHGYARNSMTRVRRAAGGRVRRRREGLHRRQAPARGRHRLLRRGDARRSSATRRRPRCKGSTEDEQFFDRKHA